MGGDPRGPARAAGGRACLFRAEIADDAVRQRHRHRARQGENRHGEPRLELQTPRLARREKCARLTGKCLPKGLEETNPEIGRPVKPGWPLSHERRHSPKIAGFFKVSGGSVPFRDHPAERDVAGRLYLLQDHRVGLDVLVDRARRLLALHHCLEVVHQHASRGCH